MTQPAPPRFDLKQLLGDSLIIKQDGKQERVSVASLDGKYVAIYFSAHWCPPCRAFTPQLVKTYTALKGKQPFEVVFVSSDRSEAAFQEYYGSMPWAAVPFEHGDVKQRLAATFKVAGIPSLILLAPDGSLVNSSARGSVAGDPDGLNFPWPGNQSLQQGGGLSLNTAILALLLLFLAYRYFFPAEKA